MSKRKWYRPMDQARIEEVFSLTVEQLRSMSLMDLVRQGGAALLKQAVAEEIRAYLRRDYYQHSGPAAASGYRNGARLTRVEVGSGGVVEYERPLISGAPDFQSRVHRRRCRKPQQFCQAIEDMYVEGVSTRKVKRALAGLIGEKTRLGRSTVSRITKRLRQEYAQWRQRSLTDFNVAYLFLDAIYLGMRMDGSRKQAVFVAYACLRNGSFVTLSIGLGNAESKVSWMNFLADLKRRGLRDPLLVTSDGNEGMIQAIEAHFPTSWRQRCAKHKVDNVLAVVPKERAEQMRPELNQIFYGSTSLEQAKAHARAFCRQYGKVYPSAVACLKRDLDQVLTFYLFPQRHWTRIRTSNRLERMNAEIKRRLRVIGRHPSEEGCLALVYKVTERYAQFRRTFKVDHVTRCLWKRLEGEKQSMSLQLFVDKEAA